MTRRSRPSRNGFAWLELLLVLAAVVLLIQIWPAFGNRILRGIDIRNWSSSVKFVANVLIVLVLIGIRFGPELLSQWRERRLRIACERAKADKALIMKKRREALERMQESRKRRIF